VTNLQFLITVPAGQVPIGSPEVRFEEMGSYGVFFALRSPRTPFGRSRPAADASREVVERWLLDVSPKVPKTLPDW
jgi:hypothetical protein